MGLLGLDTEAFSLNSETASIADREVALDVKDLGGTDERGG